MTQPPPKHRWSFEAIGTPWQLETTVKIAEHTRQQIRQYIESFDQAYSRFRLDSTARQLANQAGTYQFPSEDSELFAFYDWLYQQTDGLVTPLIGNVLEALGYDASYSLQPQAVLPEVPAWDHAVQRTGTTLTTNQPVVLDIGAAGKGYLADQLSAILSRAGYHEHIVDASGDIVYHWPEIEAVALADPRDARRAIGTYKLQAGSLCASSPAQRQWHGVHHIINPKTNTPTQTVSATWVVAASGMLADGLATALFFVAPAALEGRYAFEYAIMYADGGVQHSKTNNWEFFTA